MVIQLINHTPVEVLIKATAMPYQSKESAGLVKRVWESGHRSIARHGMASFLVQGISQNALRQLSRHPHINLTVKSSRYCNMEDAETIIPYHLKESDKEEYTDDLDLMKHLYKKWVKKEEEYPDMEQRNEVAKPFLSLNSETDLVVSGNYQALYEFLQLRNCKRAEYEIKDMANQMTKLLKVVMPQIFGKLGCKADELGYCIEKHGSCGKYEVK